MDKAYTLGRMAGSTMATTTWIRSTGLASMCGLTAGGMKVLGRMESSTEREDIDKLTARKGTESGKTARDSSGMMRRRIDSS